MSPCQVAAGQQIRVCAIAPIFPSPLLPDLSPRFPFHHAWVFPECSTFNGVLSQPGPIFCKFFDAQRFPTPPASSSRSLVENAVQSCLLIPNLATKDAVEARLLRAKSRFAAGYTLGAHRGSHLFSFLPKRSLTSHFIFARVGEPRRYRIRLDAGP